jgi:hypothetical protein
MDRGTFNERPISESTERIFVAAYPSESLFMTTTSPELTFGELMRRGPPGVLSFAVIDCTALMERVRTRLKERGA